MALITRQRAYSTASTPPLRRQFSYSSPPFSSSASLSSSPLHPPHSQSDSDPTKPVTPPSPENEFLNSGVGGAEHIQVLFAHPNSRVVNFTFSATTTLSGKPLPWNSPLERTIASGPLRIYKTVPHDVAFLQSGSALKPLLSRTQCWNVDGRMTFCLQLRPGNYWRIEILGFEFEQEIKCAEFRSAMSKIVAFEVTACPFVRADRCAPVTESPDALQPAKVWKRSMARKVVEAAHDASAHRLLEAFRDAGPAGRRQSDTGEPARPPLDPALLFRDLSPPAVAANPPPRGARLESPSVRQRRARFESLFAATPSGDDGPPPRRRRSLAGDFVFARQQWRSEHRGGKPARLVESCVFGGDADADADAEEQPDKQQPGAGASHQESGSTPFLDDYELLLPDEFAPGQRRCTTPLSAPCSPSASPLAVKSTQMTTFLDDDDDHRRDGDSSNCPSSPLLLPSQEWRDVTPPCSPHQQTVFCVTPPSAASPVLTGAAVFGSPSRPLTRPSTPECSAVPGQWYSPTPQQQQQQQQREMRVRPDGGLTLPEVDLAAVPGPPAAPPSLWDSRSEEAPSGPRTLPRPRARPSLPTAVLDAPASRPKLRRAASSLVLARAADVAAATANFVVLKPSAFLVAMMFSIAARITARAITGAAYSLAERRGSSSGGRGWAPDDWADDEDDYFLAPPRDERRRRRSETVRKKGWDERPRRGSRKASRS